MPVPVPIPPDCNPVTDPNFPTPAIPADVYCCPDGDPQFPISDRFIDCSTGMCFAFGGAGFGCEFSFPDTDVNNVPYLKTALNGTTISPFVKIAFQEYNGAIEDPTQTAENIITMGNTSQCGIDVNGNPVCNPEVCKAAIKSFQYGWGALGQGNRCKVTIIDEKGSQFESWVQRMVKNLEGAATPVQGSYRMKVQFGWYVAGGGVDDECGQPTAAPNTVPAIGENTSRLVNGPVMYFLPDMVNVHYENGKFIYDLEGVDLLVRGQEIKHAKTYGTDEDPWYFTRAVEQLGMDSTPPFRVAFKAIDANGDVVDMQFVKRDEFSFDRELPTDGCADCTGYGPLGVWRTNEKSPLAVIRHWLDKMAVQAKDLTGQVTANKGRVGITLNYDSTYRYEGNNGPCDQLNPDCQTCEAALPQYGRLVLWANSIPACQNNMADNEINKRLRAVYVVNGGNCSPVLSFTPSFRWHFALGLKAGGAMFPGINGYAMKEIESAVLANCPIAAGRGGFTYTAVAESQLGTVTPDPTLSVGEAVFNHQIANLMISAIEAELRIQGDPSAWLCSPIEGYGRCVGIIFINPFFLSSDTTDPTTECPVWAANDNDPLSFSSTICNRTLTNKGWFVLGADHQIRDGQYITTLKVKLLAPGSDFSAANASLGLPDSLGGWDAPSNEQRNVPYGGQYASVDRYVVGNRAAAWNAATDIGGGPNNIGYFTDTENPPAPTV